MRKSFTKLLFAVVLSGSCLPALAQPVGQPTHPLGDVSAFQGTPDTLVNIIQRVESTGAGRVIEIRFDDSSGTPMFDLAIAQGGGQIQFVTLASEAGQLTPVAQQSQSVWMMDWAKRGNARLATRAPHGLPEAIRVAEQAAGGKPAVAAGMAWGASSPDNDVHAYNVLVLNSDGTTGRIAVDSQTGEVIANPGSLASWP